MNLWQKSVLVVAASSYVATLSAQEGTSTESVRIEHGELSVLFRDNSQSPQRLSGIDALFNIKEAADFDAYDPDARGASAGLNFEHIISGHLNPDNKFTVNEPYYVDFEFRCTPHDAAVFGPRNYAVFFFANYMNDVQDVSLHFRGHQASDAGESWIAADAPRGHADWNQGGNYRALTASDLEYDDDVSFRLNTWSYDWPRIARPFYFGRAARGMSLTLMFDRLHSERDQIRFSLYKFNLPEHPRPAWDFQYVINEVKSGVEYGFRGRMVWKKFVSAEDCLDEYERWSAALDTGSLRLPAERVRQLKQLGATVFTRGNDVIEVNANRTGITDKDLALVSEFTQMTDLSLEETTIGDAGLAHLHHLQKLEWLNLYRCRIGDQGLKELKHLNRLQHLPIGETHVTDAGLSHLRDMRQLVYLGLRGNNVTDDGVKHLRQLDRLTGLHLGGTGITDEGLKHLEGMTSLRDLWLDRTTVSDRSVATLGKLKSLRELHVADTKITPEGVKKLAVLLPRCRITR